MPTSKRLSAYPPQLLTLFERAASLGEVRIPCDKPQALRLQLYGLKGALVANNRAELADMVGIYLAPKGEPPAVILRTKEKSDFGQIAAAALASLDGKSPPFPEDANKITEDAEAALSRILGNSLFNPGA